MKRITISELLKQPEKMSRFYSDLKSGAVAIIPTDTLYGFAVDSNSPAAVARVYEIKNRSEKKPLILFLSDSKKLSKIGISIDEEQKSLLEKHWPGALTCIFNTPQTHGLKGFKYPSLGIRIPAHRKLLKLIAGYEGMLLTTSANRSGQPSNPDPEKLCAEFSQEIDWLIEDGKLPESEASTVVDLVSRPFKVLRQGAVKI
ncbi:MAG: L-threonylcarbamoyladenylate synthase [Candidatus Rifleibacteriota bacterium]